MPAKKEPDEMPPGSPWSEQDLAYLAGIIDGEGCVYARMESRAPGRSGTRYGNLNIAIIVGNTEPLLIEWLHATFGGRTGVQRASRPGTKTLLSWTLPVRAGRTVVDAVRPYLKLKGSQLDLAVELAGLTIRTGRGRTIPPENIERRLALVEEISAMKRRVG